MGQWARLAVACACATGGILAVVACSGDYSGGGGGESTDASPETTTVTPPPPSDAGADATCDVPPADPSFLNDAVAIGAGGYHACALRLNGEVVCWGDETKSQLGHDPVDGGENRSLRPRTMGPMPKAAQLSVGFVHGCAILEGSSEVWCWGDPELDRLGYAPLGPAPHKIEDGNGAPFKATKLAAGGDFTCAVVAGGTVWCWGGNKFGQLGQPYPTGFPTLVTLSGASTVVTAGGQHACVLVGSASAPEVKCWGMNTNGQLGTNTSYDGGGTPSPTTFPTGGVAPVTVIAGLNQTCILDAARKPICSGYTTDGALGPSFAQASVTTPAAIPELASGGLKDMSIAPNHLCAIRGDDTAICTGGDLASLGRGDVDASDTGFYDPATVVGVTDPVLSNVAALATGGTYGNGPISFSCAIVKPACAPAGQVVCWGANAKGQLGDGTTTARARPVHVLAPQP